MSPRSGGEVTVVGPVPPLKGGIAQHTDRLARALLEADQDVTVETWAAQYPTFLYPGEQYVPDPEKVPPPTYRLVRSLRWFDPVSWIRCGRRARAAGTLVLTLVVPVQVVPFLVIRWVASRRRRGQDVVVVAHNVLPHEPKVGDRWLVGRLLGCADKAIVHSPAERDVARQLSDVAVDVVALPPHVPTSVVADRRGDAPTGQLLFFGLVRPYKGIADLLDALQTVPEIRLLIAGEVWGGVEALHREIDARGLGDRVVVEAGYVADTDVPALFRRCDALVLPYREGTGSQNVIVGHQLGLPVIATDVAGFGEQITNGVDGFVSQPNDPEGLAASIRTLYEPGALERMREAIAVAPDPSTEWAGYVTTLLDPSHEGRGDMSRESTS